MMDQLMTVAQNNKLKNAKHHLLDGLIGNVLKM